MKIDVSYPEAYEEYLERCHAAGQTRPTPLLLSYNEGDWNALHQDVYGENIFPIQVAFLLSEPGKDFTGGEFVLTEQRPRMQSRAEVVSLQQGDGVAFAVSHRPVQGTKGHLPSESATRRQPSALRPSKYDRNNLPRRQISASPMNLFPYEPTRNLLPFDGIVNYYGPILTPCETENYLEALLTIVPWKSDEAIICGKHIVTAVKSLGTVIRATPTLIPARPRSRCRGQGSYSLLRRLLKIKPSARSIRACATCTTTVVKEWAGTATTKRHLGRIPRLALLASAPKGNSLFDTRRRTDTRFQSNSRTEASS